MLTLKAQWGTGLFCVLLHIYRLLGGAGLFKRPSLRELFSETCCRLITLISGEVWMEGDQTLATGFTVASIPVLQGFLNLFYFLITGPKRLFFFSENTPLFRERCDKLQRSEAINKCTFKNEYAVTECSHRVLLGQTAYFVL